tara:strand:+ start:1715 stop:2794 length:1080 start_codon:yes stop_codon:yes gene_type:complete
MTVDIPSGYTATSLHEGKGVASGKPILHSPMIDIAKNNNFMIGRYNGPLAHCVFGDGPRGASTAADPGTGETGITEDLCVFLLPGDKGKRPYTAFIWCSNSDASYSGTIALRIGGTQVASVTLAAGATTQLKEVSFSNPVATTSDLVLQTDRYGIRVYSVSVVRQRYDGSTGHSDAPTEAPLYFMQDGTTRLSATEPLTDEWLNRPMNNANNIVKTQRHAAAVLAMPIKNGTLNSDDTEWTGAATSYPWTTAAGWVGGQTVQPPIAVFTWHNRFAQTVSIFTCLRAPSDIRLRIELEENTIIHGINPNYTSVPPVGSTYAFTETKRFVEKGVYTAKLFLDQSTPGGTGKLYAMSIITEE